MEFEGIQIGTKISPRVRSCRSWTVAWIWEYNQAEAGHSWYHIFYRIKDSTKTDPVNNLAWKVLVVETIWIVEMKGQERKCLWLSETCWGIQWAAISNKFPATEIPAEYNPTEAGHSWHHIFYCIKDSTKKDPFNNLTWKVLVVETVSISEVKGPKQKFLWLSETCCGIQCAATLW